MKKNVRRLVVGLMTTQGLSACSTIDSTALAPEKASTEGVVYYLPKRLLKLEFARSPAPTAPEIEKTKAALVEAKAAQAAAKKLVKSLEETLKALPSASGARARTQNALDVAVVAAAQAKSDFDDAEVALAEATAMDLIARKGKPPLIDSLSITVQPSIADTAHRYSANLKHFVSRNDKLELKTSTAGLLTNSNSKADDQSAQILVALAQSLAGTGNIGPGVAPKLVWQATFERRLEPADGQQEKNQKQPNVINCPTELTRPANLEPAPFKFDLVFDPTQDANFVVNTNGISKSNLMNPWKFIEASLCQHGADYHFDWLPPPLKMDNSDQTKDGATGLYYRRQLPHRVVVYKGKRTITPVNDTQQQAASPSEPDKTKVPNTPDKRTTFPPVNSAETWETLSLAKSFQFELPNNTPVELLAMPGSAFSIREFTSEFQDGILISHKDERPSEALSIASIPYNIVKAIFTIPAEILSLKVNYSSQQKAIVDAAKDLLASQKAYDDALKARNAAATTTP